MAIEGSRITGRIQRAGAGLKDMVAPLGGSIRIQSVAIALLVGLALFHTAYIARDVLIPIAAAFVLRFAAAPIMRGLKRLNVPTPLGAAIVVLGLVGTLAVGLYSLATPAAEWIEQAPEVARTVGERLNPIKQSVQKVQQASSEVEQAANVNGEAERVVRVRAPNLLERVAEAARIAASRMGVVLILLFFLLATGDLFKLKVVRVLSTLESKKRAIVILDQIEDQVSTFLLSTVLMNVVMGTVIALALWALGMPNPALWGVMAGVIALIPFVGSLIGMGIITVVALLSFDNLLRALAAPAIYFLITTAVAQIVSPVFLGRNLTLNPVVIILSVVIWGWLWGIPGAMLAVPLLVIVKALCDNVEGWSGIAEFLSARRSPEVDAADR